LEWLRFYRARVSFTAPFPSASIRVSSAALKLDFPYGQSARKDRLGGRDRNAVRLNCTVIQMASALFSSASFIAGRVFSGASPVPPRWAISCGRRRCWQ
jgi:hypothetical protein